jgi:DNA ligase-4
MYAHSYYSMAEVAEAIEKNGGRLADLDDPKLTHVVVDKRDDSRRVELMKRTSKLVVRGLCASFMLIFSVRDNRPKRRHLVIAEFIQACLDEETLLDEDGRLLARRK